MTTRNATLFSLILAVSLCLLVAPVIGADRVPKDLGKDKGQSIVIKSNSLEVDNKKRVVAFTGDVDARRDDLIINCDKMFVYYSGNMRSDPSQKSDLKMEKIVAKGGVRISRPSGGLATAEEAVYYQSDERVVLTGNPTVKQGDDMVEGTTITLYLREDRSIVEGSDGKQVKAVISSGMGGR
jgi:lipopolysaccharide export system protein LptA